MPTTLERGESFVVERDEPDKDRHSNGWYRRIILVIAGTALAISGTSKQATAHTEGPSTRDGILGVAEAGTQNNEQTHVVEPTHDNYDRLVAALPSPDKWLKVVDYSGPDGYIKVLLGSTSPTDNDPYADVNTPYIFSVLDEYGNWIDLMPDNVTRLKSGQMVKVRTRSGTALAPIQINFTDTVFGTDAEDQFGVTGECRDGHIRGSFTAANEAGASPTLRPDAYYALFEPVNGPGTVMVITSLIEDGRQADAPFDIEPGEYKYNVYGTDKPLEFPMPDQIAQLACDEDGNGEAIVSYTVPETGDSLNKPAIRPSGDAQRDCDHPSQVEGYASAGRVTGEGEVIVKAIKTKANGKTRTVWKSTLTKGVRENEKFRIRHVARDSKIELKFEHNGELDYVKGGKWENGVCD